MTKHKMHPQRKQPGQAECHHGFTLVEIMITMAIASFILAAAFTIFTNYTRSNTVQTVAADIQQDLRAVISFMEQDIRSAGMNPRELATLTGFTEADATTFTFTSDNDFNGLVAVDDPSTADDELLTSPDEWIRYTIDTAAGTLTRQNLEGAQTLLTNITNPTAFEYNENNDVTIGVPVPLASLSDIRSVNIRISLSEPAGRFGTVSRTMETRVYCRNLNL